VSWAPTQVSGLSLWLDGADSSSITLVNGKISQWNDKSGNARHATQPTDSMRPTQTVAGPEFDGISDYLDLASQPFTGTTPRTVFAVIEPDVLGDLSTGGSSRSFFSASEAFGASLSVGQLWDLGVEFDGAYIRIFGNDYFTPTPSLAKMMMAYQWESGDSGNSSVWHDGSALSRAGGSSKTVSTVGGIARIGRAKRQGDSHYAGVISEIIVISGSLSTVDRQAIDGYLAHKWGLDNNLPIDHPFKSVAPGIVPTLGTITTTAVTSDSISFSLPVTY